MNIGVHATLLVSIRTSSGDARIGNREDGAWRHVASDAEAAAAATPPAASQLADASSDLFPSLSTPAGNISLHESHFWPVFDRARPSVRADTRRAQSVAFRWARGSVVVIAWTTRRCLIVRVLTDTPSKRARKTGRRHVKFGVFDRSRPGSSFLRDANRLSLSSVSVRHGPLNFRQRRRHQRHIVPLSLVVTQI